MAPGPDCDKLLRAGDTSQLQGGHFTGCGGQSVNDGFNRLCNAPGGLHGDIANHGNLRTRFFGATGNHDRASDPCCHVRQGARLGTIDEY